MYAIEDLVSMEWYPEHQIPPELRADVVSALDEPREPELLIDIVIPGNPVGFTYLRTTLQAIEPRVRLAVLLAFMDADRARRYPHLGELLRDFQQVPLFVTHLGVSSIEIKITGDAEEIAKLLGNGGKAPRKWRRSLLKTLAAMLAGSALTLTIQGTSFTQVQPPPAAQVQREIQEICGYVPDGTEITVKSGPVEAKVPCKKPQLPPPAR